MDPDGRVIPFVTITAGAAGGLALELGVSKLKEFCGCREKKTLAGPVGHVAAGTVIGAFGPFLRKPSGRIARGGPSGSITSSFSTLVGRAYRYEYISADTKNILRPFGRNVTKRLPVLGTALLAVDLIDLARCISK